MATKHLIGIDMGATNLRAGLVADDELLEIETVAIDQSGGVDPIIAQLIDCIDKIKTHETGSIGIGVPSVVDVEKGIVYDVVNIPSWKEVHLKEILEDEFNIPVYINNDANCFAVGEKYFGRARGYNSVVGVTIGSGMGSGVVLDGRLYSGSNCGAGEIGMVPYKDSVMEHYTSGQFFEREHNTDGTELFKLAQEDDPEALQIYKEFGTHVGVAMKTIMYMFDPEIIVLGGSVSQAYPLFKESMLHEMQNFGYPKSLEKIEIKVSEQKHIAILGAAALILDRQAH